VQLARLTKRQARDMVERRAGKGRQAGTPAPLEQQAKSEEGKS
jgi:ribosome modulation factor